MSRRFFRIDTPACLKTAPGTPATRGHPPKGPFMFEVWEKIIAFEPNKNVKTLKIKPQHSRHAIMAMCSIWKPGIAFLKRAILFTFGSLYAFCTAVCDPVFSKNKRNMIQVLPSPPSLGWDGTSADTIFHLVSRKCPGFGSPVVKHSNPSVFRRCPIQTSIPCTVSRIACGGSSILKLVAQLPNLWPQFWAHGICVLPSVKSALSCDRLSFCAVSRLAIRDYPRATSVFSRHGRVLWLPSEMFSWLRPPTLCQREVQPYVMFGWSLTSIWRQSLFIDPPYELSILEAIGPVRHAPKTLRSLEPQPHGIIWHGIAWYLNIHRYLNIYIYIVYTLYTKDASHCALKNHQEQTSQGRTKKLPEIMQKSASATHDGPPVKLMHLHMIHMHIHLKVCICTYYTLYMKTYIYITIYIYIYIETYTSIYILSMPAWRFHIFHLSMFSLDPSGEEGSFRPWGWQPQSRALAGSPQGVRLGPPVFDRNVR